MCSSSAGFYRVILGTGVRETLGAWMASAALAHVIVVANLWALAGRHVPWKRTDKFRPVRQRAGALGAAWTELVIGLSCLGMAAVAIAVLPGSGIATMLAVGVVLQGLTYMAAPTMAVVADRDLRRHLDNEVLDSWDPSLSAP